MTHHSFSFVGFALAIGVAVSVPQKGLGQIAVGDAFPNLAAPGLLSRIPPATAGKVVLVDFWASWCAPCKASFPTYAKIDSEFAPRGLVIIAVSVDQDTAAFGRFVSRFGPPFFVACDQNQKLVSAVRVPTMPTSYLIDRHGKVRYLHAGFHGSETEAMMRKEIESLLAEEAF